MTGFSDRLSNVEVRNLALGVVSETILSQRTKLSRCRRFGNALRMVNICLLYRTPYPDLPKNWRKSRGGQQMTLAPNGEVNKQLK